MTPDEWQAHVTRAAALEIGKWLEARGKLHQPIASFTLGDLELKVCCAQRVRSACCCCPRAQRAPQTPLNNSTRESETPLSHPGLVAGDVGWGGDSLQLRIIADPDRKDPRSAMGELPVCWVTAWGKTFSTCWAMTFFCVPLPFATTSR